MNAHHNPRPTPAHVEPYVRVLGLEGAIEFLLTFGGAQLYLPHTPQGRSKLAQVVGIEKAARLAEVSDRLPRRVPTAKPWIATVWRSQGLPVDEIARRLHMSDVTVRKWLKKAAAAPSEDTQQPRLL
ncbi:sigma factor-like helix-turn-helix DNA-binding protein [Limimaricola variabilis]|uniref:sigma factor-like helix-turn-helix DNA-binding protein n=1 Tax=Limimaricola variabilis TaxID=1492771 RepID=UPI002AC90B50|nr:sigma factor-like helix-turn-helix DNA-binding protein [Limimaricola variabilis]WPY94698.1 sigma factor-like helix-turn-helix DNA-binding protein [Limimaricola variabilis]